MNTGPLHLRIFLSSPGDVPHEREAIVQLVKEKLPYHNLICGRVTFEILAWDDRAQRVALLAGESGQASVDRALGVPSACDLTVVILWARLGTPPGDRPPKPDGTPYRSGTEWELWDALNAKKPVLICRRLAKPEVDHTNLDEVQEFARQARLVDDFIRDLAAQKINVNTYKEPSEVAALVEGELTRIVRRRLDARGSGASENAEKERAEKIKKFRFELNKVFKMNYSLQYIDILDESQQENIWRKFQVEQLDNFNSTYKLYTAYKIYLSESRRGKIDRKKDEVDDAHSQYIAAIRNLFANNHGKMPKKVDGHEVGYFRYFEKATDWMRLLFSEVDEELAEIYGNLKKR